ncbi:MAG: ABC transporter ATP-binding protein [Actinomycetia bacterium]|nr:ABC transporter ATP-binding protein [Actinomycetes bacterium]
MAELALENVTKRFGTVEACSSINLTIRDGEFVTLLGPSGCGKSTTLNMIAGLDDVSEGQILMDGQVVNNLTPFQRDVAMVFQSYALYPHMTVEQNIAFTLKLRKLDKAKIAERVGAVAELLELTPYLKRLPRELSGGQQQRVAIGRAVVREPRLFLFDEPFSNLDAALRVKMRTEIKQLHQRLGITSVFVTHDQEEALSISDRVAVMSRGRVEQFATPEEIYSRPASMYVASFIGSPQLDVMSGAFERAGEQLGYRVAGSVFPMERTLRVPDEAVDLGIRAEHVYLDADGGVAASVIVSQLVGPFTYVTVQFDGGTLTSRIPGIVHYPSGARVGVRLDPHGMLWFSRSGGQRLDLRSE